MKYKKQVVFLETYSTVMTYKIARLFKKKGYETVLIRVSESNKRDSHFYDDAYDKIINLNINLSIKSNIFSLHKKLIVLIRILKLRPYVIFGKANPNLPVALFRILFNQTPFIYFPYDIRCQYSHPNPVYAMKTRGLSRAEIKAERFCFEHADGIMHKGSPEELKHLNGRMLGDNIKLSKHQITFHPYCSKEFCVPINKNKLSKIDNEIHTVYLTTGGEINRETYKIFFDFAKRLITQKIHYHLYVGKIISSKIDRTQEFIKKNKDYPNFKYFHIEESRNPKEIVKEISKYDFGLLSHFLEENLTPIEQEERLFELEQGFAVTNKVSTYMEAGIPVLCSPEIAFSHKLYDNYKILPLPNPNIKNLNEKLHRIDYKQLEKNLLKAREDFDMDKNFPRLEKFVKEIVASKKKNKNPGL